MIYIGIDQSLSFTGMTIKAPDRTYFYGITHKPHTKWDKWNGDKSGITIINYIYKEKVEDSIENERIKFNNIIELVSIIRTILSSVQERYKNEEIEVRMEGVSYGSRATTAIAELSALNYFIRKVCWDLDITFTILTPSSIKKFFTGNGVADKELMMETFFRLEPRMRQVSKYIKMDDIADSYAMACWSE